METYAKVIINALMRDYKIGTYCRFVSLEINIGIITIITINYSIQIIINPRYTFLEYIHDKQRILYYQRQVLSFPEIICFDDDNYIKMHLIALSLKARCAYFFW